MSDNQMPHGTGAARSPRLGEPHQSAQPQSRPSSAKKAAAKPPAARAVRKTQLMPNRPIPKMGIPALLYKFNVAIGKPQWVPRLSRKETAAHEHQDLLDYRDRLQVAIRNNIQQRTFTATTTSVKGGAAKTTVSCYVASMLGETARRTVTLIDSNPDWGTAYKLLGVSREATHTVREVRDALLRHELQTHDEFVGQLGSTQHGVSLIASDALNQREDRYDYETAKLVTTNAQRNSIFVINDTGTGIAGDSMQATLELSDVMIVPTRTTDDTLTGAGVTIGRYRDWGHGNLTRHSVVVVNGLKPGDQAENYREKLGLAPDHVLVGIPYEERVHDNAVVDLRMNGLHSVIAYLELVYVVTSVAMHVQTNGYDSNPLSFEQGRLVSIPSGRTPVLPYVHPQDKE